MARLILFLLRPAWAERLPARLFEGSKEPELPQLPDCEGGVLRLGSGQYRVAEEGAQWSSPCALEADGAQILLDGPLLAEGNLTLRGSLHFTGRNSFFQACVHVGGDLQVHGAMSVSNCSNLRKVRKDNTRDGGCVRAWRLEILPTGRLELRNCSAARAGGGLYVGGGGLDQDGALSIFDGAAHMAGCAAVTGLWRHSGSTKMSNCSARGAGGGALAKSGLQLRGGEMQLADCRAEGEGGCLMVLEGVNQTGGALHIFRGRGVGLGGCASVAGGLRLSRAGRLVFRDCAVEDAPKLPEKYAGNGGALYLSGNLEQEGHLEFAGCRASNIGMGGCLSLYGGWIFNGSFTAEDGHAGRRGGCVALERGDDATRKTGFGWLTQKGGAMSFSRCSSLFGGCVSTKNVVMLRGKMDFRHCNTAKLGGEGGGLLVDQNLLQAGGSIRFQDCAAGTSGGGVEVGRRMEVNGSMTFEMCSVVLLSFSEHKRKNLAFLRATGKTGQVSGGGGGASVGGLLLAGVLRFAGCRSASVGGALRVQQRGHTGPAAFIQQGGHLSCEDNSADFEGGCVCSLAHPQYNFSRRVGILQNGGSMSFQACSANVGGGLFSDGWVVLKSSVSFDGCSALRGGGAASAPALELEGDARIRRCSSEGRGGGLHVTDAWAPPGVLLAKGGNLTIEECHAAKGGAMWANASVQLQGRLRLSSCYANFSGGGLYLERGDLRLSGALEASNCSAQQDGGSLFLNQGSLDQEAGLMDVKGALARYGHGGAVCLKEGALIQRNGNMSFTASTAGKTGGCLAVMEKNFVQHRGVMRFDHCHAGELGGGFSVLQLRARGLDLKLQGELILHNCSAWLSGGAFYTTLPAEISLLRVGDVGGGSAGGASLGSQARLNLQDLRIENHVSRDFIVLATSWKLGLPVQCPVATNRCAFHGVHDVNTSVPLCPAGAGLEEVAEVQSTSQSAESIDEGSRRGSMGCYRCDPDYFQLQNLSRARCQRCPRHTDTCLPNELRMWEGYMLLGDKGYICPNPRVCPGGALPFNQPPMCAEGYVGQGCMTCASTHGISDASILSCVRCALSSFEQLKQGAVTVVKDGAIFAMAAFGAMASVAEGREAEVKISGILVNQLMAFSTVASTAMSAVLETSAAKALRKDIATSLQVSVHLVDFAQGESSGGFSTHCMLSYLGLQRGMVAAHVLVSVVPVVLMLLLAWKEPTMAFVVGSNCFMPRFCADFCKYCVFFRVEVGGELLFPYLPAALSPMQGIWMASLGFGLCLVLVVSLWVTVASSKQKPMPATVAYLVRPYRPECAAMEVERLVRKTLLKSAAAALPAVSKPASQLACVSLVMSCSLASYALFMPYKISKANYSEVVLLLAGLLLAILTNWLVANDIRGDASIGAQLVLLAAIALLGTSISVLMMGLILYFWRLERAANQT